MRRRSAWFASIFVLAGGLLANCGWTSTASRTAPVPETAPPSGGSTVDAPPPLPTPSEMLTLEQVQEIAAAALGGYPTLAFNIEQERALATVGTPAEQFTLWTGAFPPFEPGQPLSTLVTPRHSWLVPATVDGDGRNTLLVGWADGAWRDVGRGELTGQIGNLTAVQQHHAQRFQFVKIILMPPPLLLPLAWVTEDGHDVLILLSTPPPPLTVKAMEPYPAGRC